MSEFVLNTGDAESTARFRMTTRPFLPPGWEVAASDSGKRYVRRPLGDGFEESWSLRQWMLIQAGEGRWRNLHISIFGATPEETALAALEASQ